MCLEEETKNGGVSVNETQLYSTWWSGLGEWDMEMVVLKAVREDDCDNALFPSVAMEVVVSKWCMKLCRDCQHIPAKHEVE